VQKLISASSFQLKGSGWYLTDYARAGNGKAKKGEASESSGASGSEPSASSGETKTGKTGSKAAAGFGSARPEPGPAQSCLSPRLAGVAKPADRRFTLFRYSGAFSIF